MLTKQQIEDGKKATTYTNDVFHEHDDCIRIAYEWFDAQTKTKSPYGRPWSADPKHFVECWGGRYVSQADVDVAAQLHPAIKGHYPNYNLKFAFTLPSVERLSGIEEAFTQAYKIGKFEDNIYKSKETFVWPKSASLSIK